MESHNEEKKDSDVESEGDSESDATTDDDKIEEEKTSPETPKSRKFSFFSFVKTIFIIIIIALLSWSTYYLFIIIQNNAKTGKKMESIVSRLDHLQSQQDIITKDLASSQNKFAGKLLNNKNNVEKVSSHVNKLKNDLDILRNEIKVLSSRVLSQAVANDNLPSQDKTTVEPETIVKEAEDVKVEIHNQANPHISGFSKKEEQELNENKSPDTDKENKMVDNKVIELIESGAQKAVEAIGNAIKWWKNIIFN